MSRSWIAPLVVVAVCRSAAAGLAVSVVEARATSVLLRVDADTAREAQAQGSWQTVQSGEGARGSVRFLQDGLTGSRCATLTGSADAPGSRVELVQELATPLQAGRVHQVTFQARGTVGSSGEALVCVEERDPGSGAWATVLRVVVEVAATWLESGGEFRPRRPGAPTRIVLRLVGRGTVSFDSVVLRTADSRDNLLVDGSFDGGCYWRLAYRPLGESEWRTDPAVIREELHRLVGLAPGTQYEVRAERYTPSGDRVAVSPCTAAQTATTSQRPLPGLAATESTHIADPSLRSPCLVAAGDTPCLVADHGGGIYIHPIGPDASVGQPLRVVAPVEANGRLGQVADLEAAAVGATVYVAYRLVFGEGPNETSARVSALDLRTGRCTGPVSVAPADASRWVTRVAIAACQGRLWAAIREEAESHDNPAPRLLLRPLSPTTLAPDGPDVVVDDAPSQWIGPSLAAFGDALAVFYTEPAFAPSPGRPTDEPLVCRLFSDGRLGPAIVVAAEGRNRGARAAETAGRLLVVWPSAGGYPGAAPGWGPFQDVGIAAIGRDGRLAEPARVTHDNLYDAEPSIVVTPTGPLVVFRRWEHVPSVPGDAAQDLGLWCARVVGY